jgi:hypothetical protein
MLARCRGAFFLLLAPFLILSAGCRNKTDLVEAELRTRDAMYREAVEEQRRIEAHNFALQREIEAIRQGSKISPEHAAQTFSLKRIALGRATGGVDNDNVPGDEALQVVVEPRDGDDHTIKAPGMLQIGVLEISPQGVKTPLCSWDIPPEQLRQSWKQGLLSTGYSLTLPWRVLPATEQVRVVVRFILPDNRVFEADKDIKVRLVPGAAQRRLEGMPDAPFCPTPDMGPLLVPTGRTSNSSPNPATPWRAMAPAPLTLGQPELP